LLVLWTHNERRIENAKSRQLLQSYLNLDPDPSQPILTVRFSPLRIDSNQKTAIVYRELKKGKVKACAFKIITVF